MAAPSLSTPCKFLAAGRLCQTRESFLEEKHVGAALASLPAALLMGVPCAMLCEMCAFSFSSKIDQPDLYQRAWCFQSAKAGHLGHVGDGSTIRAALRHGGQRPRKWDRRRESSPLLNPPLFLGATCGGRPLSPGGPMSSLTRLAMPSVKKRSAVPTAPALMRQAWGEGTVTRADK